MAAAILVLLALCGAWKSWAADRGRGAGIVDARDANPASAHEVLDRRSFLYRDPHEGGRVIAVIELELLGGAGGSALRLRPSAVGALVEPVRDLRGIAGANHRTARELDALVVEDALVLRVRSEDGTTRNLPLAGGHGAITAPCERAPDHAGSAPEPSALVRSERGSVPERRVRDDGSIDHDAHSSAQHVTAIELVTPQLERGRHTVEVVVRGQVRLAVDLALEAAGGRIVAVRGQAADSDSPLTPKDFQP